MISRVWSYGSGRTHEGPISGDRVGAEEPPRGGLEAADTRTRGTSGGDCACAPGMEREDGKEEEGLRE